MAAVLLTGHGGFDKLDYRTDVATPKPGPGEVLIQVRAAGVNNTDINTRIGWYSKSVRSDTNAGGQTGFAAAADDDASWSGVSISFPRIQGTDCCGHIVAVGDGVDPARVRGELTLLRRWMKFGCAAEEHVRKEKAVAITVLLSIVVSPFG